LRPHANPQAALADQKARVASRLGAAYLMRSLEMLARLAGGDLMAGLVSMAIVQANVAHLEEAGGGRFDGLNEIPPDSVRRPVSVLALSAYLGLPYETARRHVGKLISAGVCVRVKGGVVVRAATLESDAHAEMLRAHMANLRRLVQGLASAGISFA
jgi:hypothetical protein